MSDDASWPWGHEGADHVWELCTCAGKWCALAFCSLCGAAGKPSIKGVKK